VRTCPKPSSSAVQGPSQTRWLGGATIGIAHGFATLGTIGFEGRFDYAAIGTVSNVASRLCDEAKPGQILISPEPVPYCTKLLDDIGFAAANQCATTIRATELFCLSQARRNRCCDGINGARQ
jgi:class 3 adenylate cyclase